MIIVGFNEMENEMEKKWKKNGETLRGLTGYCSKGKSTTKKQ